MTEFSRYIVTVDYTKYVGGSEPEAETTATLDVWDVSEEQARGQAKRHVAAVVGEQNVGSTTLEESGEDQSKEIGEFTIKDTRFYTGDEE